MLAGVISGRNAAAHVHGVAIGSAALAETQLLMIT